MAAPHTTEFSGVITLNAGLNLLADILRANAPGLFHSLVELEYMVEAGGPIYRGNHLMTDVGQGKKNLLGDGDTERAVPGEAIFANRVGFWATNAGDKLFIRCRTR
jgi:hypothetical protein